MAAIMRATILASELPQRRVDIIWRPEDNLDRSKLAETSTGGDPLIWQRIDYSTISASILPVPKPADTDWQLTTADLTYCN